MVRHKHTPQNSLYVGDRPEDEEAARRAGVPFQWAWDWIEQHRGFYLREIALIQEYGGQIELLYLDRYEQGEVISLLFDAAGERVAGGGDQGFFGKIALCNG